MFSMNGAPAYRLPKATNLRNADVFALAGRHSRRVRFLKLGIPIFALLLGGVFALATVFRQGDPVAVTTDGVSLSDGRIVMAGPKLDGMTKDKRPYKMRAERAFQDIKKNGIIELEKMTAQLPFGPANTATLSAAKGVYDNIKRKMDLTSEIVLKTSDGMVVKLKTAHIDIANNHLSTSDTVDITTPSAKITADSMIVSEGGKRLVFDKRVRLTIDPSKINQTGTAKSAN
jgi:lipopolysaccharide export system protein LptC